MSDERDQRRVVDLPAALTHPLRRLVLRDDDPSAELAWPGDDDVTTTHLGIRRSDGTVVAISTWLERPWPPDPDRPAMQLRGMASHPDAAGTGLGTMLLDAGLRHARSRDVEIVWANARVDALGFYGRAGFTVSGPVFITPDTGLPHRIVHRLVEPVPDTSIDDDGLDGDPASPSRS